MQVFKDGNFPTDLNATMIALIPKKEKKDAPELVSQIRPIALCNVLMKVITKTISNRLKPLMTKLIGDT